MTDSGSSGRSKRVGATPEDLHLGTARGRWVLTATVLGSAMAQLDATVVGIAQPAIGKDFHATIAGLQWVSAGYLLTVAGLILLAGALCDRYGRRRIFVIGVAWFAVASLICAVAPNIGLLIAARMLQGVRRRAAHAREASPFSRRRSPRKSAVASSAHGPDSAASPLRWDHSSADS